jgi:hypothetical protein
MSSRISEPRAKKAEMNLTKQYYAKPTRKVALNAICAYFIGRTAIEQENGQEDHLERSFRTKMRNCIVVRCPLFRLSAMYNMISDFEKTRQLYAPSIAARSTGEPS